MTEQPQDFDSCNRECRKPRAHTYRWGGCQHAPQPERTVSISHTHAADDGYPAIGFDVYTAQQLADLIAPALLKPEEGFALPYDEEYGRALALGAAKAVICRNDAPGGTS